jgi:nucleoid-associated protein YgaU
VIFKGSRNADTEVISPMAPDGRTPRVLATREAPPAPGVIEYIVCEGDRLDTLAARFYGDATKSWLILDANPEPLSPLELLVPGRTIRIPKNRIVGP